MTIYSFNYSERQIIKAIDLKCVLRYQCIHF